MRFASEGLIFIGIAFAVAAAAMAFALQRRSWPLWLVAAALFVAALCVAYVFRGDPATRSLTALAEFPQP